MSFSSPQRPLIVQNLKTDELIDLIKNDEYYSGCCRIIEEKHLSGIDVLNLSEYRLKTWRLPQWLIRKLVSLKDKLSNDPDSLLSFEEENPDLDSKKQISNTLTTLFKNKQIPILPTRKPVDESSDSRSIRKEPERVLPYDDDNYLKADFKRPPKESKFNKPTPKLPNTRAPEVSRKPIALPRSDSDAEENTYEPPPSHKITQKKIASKPLPLPPPPAEVLDAYELPPRLGGKLSDSLEDLQYEYIETKKTSENAENQRKTSTAKFYVDSDFPPPLPERTLLQKQEITKWLNPPVYMNVEDAQSPNANSISTERRKSSPNIRQSSLTNTRAVSPVVQDTKKVWSTLTRPLPPLPIHQDTRSSRAKIARKETESPETETLPEYLNTTESSSNKPSNSSLLSELKQRTSNKNDLSSQILNVQLKKTSPMKDTRDENPQKSREQLQKKRGNTTSLKAQMKLPLPPVSFPSTETNIGHSDTNREYDNSEDQPEYGNTIETNTKPPAWRPQQNNHSPLGQFAQEISQRRPKPTTPEPSNFPGKKLGAQESAWEVHEETESDFEDDFDEEDAQPEYLNTLESQLPEPEVKKSASNIQTNRATGLASLLANVQLKSTSKKDIPVGNKLSDELTAQLQKRRGHLGKHTDEEMPTNYQTKSISKPSNVFNSNIGDERYLTMAYNGFADKQPEHNNTIGKKLKPTVWRNQQENVSPPSQLAHEISKKVLKPPMPDIEEQDSSSKRNYHGEIGNEFENDHDVEEDLPEYLNTPETQTFETRVRKAGLNNQAKKSTLASQLAQVQLKSTPKKYINLDDEVADELRILLQKRKGLNERAEDGPNPVNSYNKSEKTPSHYDGFNMVDDKYEEDEGESDQENYDVAGSYNDLLNFNNEPYYRNTDRKGAILLLEDLEDGAFLLRPSRKFFLSITIKYKGKYFNLGIEKTPNNKIFCGEESMRTKEFFSLKSFLEYFEHSPLLLQGESGIEEVFLKKVLPPERY